MSTQSHSDIAQDLKENGPRPIEGGAPRAIRDDPDLNITRFELRSTHSGDLRNGVQAQTAVYFLDTHTPEEVIRAWVAENEGFVDDVGAWTAHIRVTHNFSEFSEVSKEILGPFSPGKHGDGNVGGTCSHCGEEYAGHFPDHVMDCEVL